MRSETVFSSLSICLSIVTFLVVDFLVYVSVYSHRSHMFVCLCSQRTRICVWVCLQRTRICVFVCVLTEDTHLQERCKTHIS